MAGVKKLKESDLYIAEYRCGCSAESRFRGKLLSYCSTHGDSRRRIHRIQAEATAKQPDAGEGEKP